MRISSVCCCCRRAPFVPHDEKKNQWRVTVAGERNHSRLSSANNSWEGWLGWSLLAVHRSSVVYLQANHAVRCRGHFCQAGQDTSVCGVRKSWWRGRKPCLRPNKSAAVGVGNS